MWGDTIQTTWYMVYLPKCRWVYISEFLYEGYSHRARFLWYATIWPCSRATQGPFFLVRKCARLKLQGGKTMRKQRVLNGPNNKGLSVLFCPVCPALLVRCLFMTPSRPRRRRIVHRLSWLTEDVSGAVFSKVQLVLHTPTYKYQYFRPILKKREREKKRKKGASTPIFSFKQTKL